MMHSSDDSSSKCVHVCFASTSMREKKEALLNHRTKNLPLCDGSRKGGCQGCHCRTLSTTQKQGRCDRCGKYIYELLDRLWCLRSYSKMYNKVCLNYNPSPACTEVAIENIVHRSMRRFRFQLGILPRSKLLHLYTKATRIVTHFILLALLERTKQPWLLPGRGCNPRKPSFWFGPHFPLKVMQILGCRESKMCHESKIYAKYEYRGHKFIPVQ